jgi:ribosomal protein S18 acetylase RimI-like enzyme
MSTLAFRDAGPDDDAALFQLFTEVRSEELRMEQWDPEPRSQLLRVQFEAQRRGYREQCPGAHARLILCDGSPAGWVIVDRSGPVIHCVDIAIVSGARNAGIGTWVFRGLQEEAAAGARPLVITVLRSNVRARSLYVRLGFRVIRETDLHTLMEWRPAPDAGFVHTDPATYREHLGTIFGVDHELEPVQFRLAEVTDERVGGGFGQFSLIFHGPADPVLSQGMYSFRHDALGSLALFIVPVVGSNADRTVYQACFSRPVPPASGDSGT